MRWVVGLGQGEVSELGVERRKHLRRQPVGGGNSMVR